ncbi:MAG: acyltransferase [Dyadobacter sp.]|uniref:acyltransferase family protein n=1 Tax=Dyadobacter sp. TaxID=1914288 RepID=UPI0032651C82
MEQEKNLGYNPHDSKINSIQVLRGIAALIVTIYHLKDVVKKSDPFAQELDFLFNSGPAGVALFFVISGFIMVYITRNTRGSLTGVYQFIVKRFIRIWPAYVVITVFYYLLQHRIEPDQASLTELALSIFFIPASATEPPFYGYATLPVGWSLNYEIYFYLLIAISLCFAKYRWYVFFLLIIVAMVVVPSIFGNFTLKPNEARDYGSAYLNMITNPIVWNFVYGVLLGLIYNNPALSRGFSAFFSKKWLAATCIALAGWQYVSGFFGGLGPLQWGVGSTLLFAAFIFYTKGRTIIFPAWLVRLGDISFSIYLIHLPVVVAVSYVFSRIGYPVYSTGTAMFCFSLSLTLIFSHISYEYLEIRLSNHLKGYFSLNGRSKMKVKDRAKVI